MSEKQELCSVTGCCAPHGRCRNDHVHGWHACLRQQRQRAEARAAQSARRLRTNAIHPVSDIMNEAARAIDALLATPTDSAAEPSNNPEP